MQALQDPSEVDRMSSFIQAAPEVGYKGGFISHEYPVLRGDCGKQISDGWVVGYLRAMVQVIGS